MRICLYTETALPKIGGQELVVDALARHFTTAGHEVVVLCQPPRRPLRPDDHLRPYRVERHPRFLSSRYFVAWYGRRLERLHREAPLDVVHCHSVYPCGYVAAAVKQSLGVPLVITSHGGDVRPDNPRFRKRGLHQRHREAVAAADALVAISDFTADGFRRLGAPRERIVPIPNGVELDVLRTAVERPDELSPAIQPDRYWLFLGRLSPRKGVDVLLDAYARLSPERRLPLVVAGDGDSRAELEALAARLGLAGSVHFVGRAAGRLKTYLLQNAYGLVMPSRQWEAFPLTLLEGFAAGLPIIGTRIPGLADLLADGKTGLVVPPESPADLAAALDRLTTHGDEARRLGERARAQARHFDWRTVAERHLALFDDLTTGRTRRRAA